MLQIWLLWFYEGCQILKSILLRKSNQHTRKERRFALRSHFSHNDLSFFLDFLQIKLILLPLPRFIINKGVLGVWFFRSSSWRRNGHFSARIPQLFPTNLHHWEWLLDSDRVDRNHFVQLTRTAIKRPHFITFLPILVILTISNLNFWERIFYAFKRLYNRSRWPLMNRT